MMKKFLLIPFIMSALTLPILAEEGKKTEASQIEMVASPRFLDEVAEGYQDGKYSSFLKNIHRQYEEASKKREYRSFLEERKKLSALVNDFRSAKNEAFQKKINDLQEHQNRELIDLCLAESTPFSRDVKDMIFFTPSKEEKESLDFVTSLGNKFKGDGTSPIENKLIGIDTEFWLKQLSLDVLLTQKKIDPNDYKEKRLVLEMEKIHQMQEACKANEVDPKIKKYIDTAATVYPKVKAASMTRKHLNDLAKGTVQPQNLTEQKMKEVVVKYTEKENALLNQ